MSDWRSAKRRLRVLGRRARERWRRLERPGAEPGRSAADDLLAPRAVVRGENLAVAVAAFAGLVLATDAPPLSIAVLLLAPDLSLAGYLVDETWGRRAYNAVHAYWWPVAAGVVGWSLGSAVAVWIALAWAAHLGVDRAAGLGLKYEGAEFRDTHVQRIGADETDRTSRFRRRP